MALAALIVAIIGATTGIAALVWNVITWQRQGPLVTLDAEFQENGDSSEIVAIAWNTGRSDAHIEHLSLMWTKGDPDDEEATCRANVAPQNIEAKARAHSSERFPPHENLAS